MDQEEIGGPYQDVSIHRESDDQDVTFPTITTGLSSPLSPAPVSSNHLDHGSLLLNGVNGVEGKTNI